MQLRGSPAEQARGYFELFAAFERALCEIVCRLQQHFDIAPT